MWWLFSGRYLHVSFNTTLHHFFVKKEKSGDKDEVIRCYDELCPIGLKITANKIIGGVCNWQLRKPLAKFLVNTQRGFTYERVALRNVIDLDCASRAFAMQFPMIMPVLLAFDFGSAFASAAQAWIFVVLHVMNLPAGFIDLCYGFFSYIIGVSKKSNGITALLFLVNSGVVQGCSLSGLLFAIAINPFLAEMVNKIDNRDFGVTRACADDIGVCPEVFAHAECFATLFLKIPKCVLTPLSTYLPAAYSRSPVHFTESRSHGHYQMVQFVASTLCFSMANVFCHQQSVVSGGVSGAGS